MEMDEKKALDIIEQMISTAKREIRDNGFFYLLWGWLVLLGCIADYIMLVIMKSEYHAMSWAILMPLGGLISIIATVRESKQMPRVKTYVDEVMKYVVIAFVVSLIVVCFLMPFTQSWRAFFPVLMILYAIFLFISSAALRFRPLMFGAVANWALAVAGFFVTYDIQLLLLAAAVLLGYIVPGYMLNIKFKRESV